MFFIWLIIFNIQPFFALLGLIGILGEEAQNAAVITALAWVIGLLLLAVVAILYFLGTWVYGLISFSAIAAFA